MHNELLIRKWVKAEEILEAEVLSNIYKIKKLRKFQGTEEYWDLITSCWKFKDHVDKKNKAFKKKFSKIDLISSIERTIPVHDKKRKITNAFINYACKIINEMDAAPKTYQRKWMENAEKITQKSRLNKAYKLWTDIYVWSDEDIVQKIFTHMEVYNNEIYTLRNSISALCKSTSSNSEHILKYLMNQFAKNNKELF